MSIPFKISIQVDYGFCLACWMNLCGFLSYRDYFHTNWYCLPCKDSQIELCFEFPIWQECFLEVWLSVSCILTLRTCLHVQFHVIFLLFKNFLFFSICRKVIGVLIIIKDVHSDGSNGRQRRMPPPPHRSNFFPFSCRFRQKLCQTSMHSSRMRTSRLLPISPSMHCWGCLLLGGVSSGGCLLPGSVCSWWVCLLLGRVCSLEGWCIPACNGADTPTPTPPPCGQTDTCENITFTNFSNNRLVPTELAPFREIQDPPLVLIVVQHFCCENFNTKANLDSWLLIVHFLELLGSNLTGGDIFFANFLFSTQGSFYCQFRRNWWLA